MKKIIVIIAVLALMIIMLTVSAKAIELEARVNGISHIQIKTGLSISEYGLWESYTSSIQGNTQIFNVRLQNITGEEFYLLKPRQIPLRKISLILVNNNSYPVRFSWNANSVKYSNTELPISVLINNELLSHNKNIENVRINDVSVYPTSGYIVIPSNSSDNIILLLASIHDIANESVNMTIDFNIIKNE